MIFGFIFWVTIAATAVGIGLLIASLTTGNDDCFISGFVVLVISLLFGWGMLCCFVPQKEVNSTIYVKVIKGDKAAFCVDDTGELVYSIKNITEFLSVTNQQIVNIARTDVLNTYGVSVKTNYVFPNMELEKK